MNNQNRFFANVNGKKIGLRSRCFGPKSQRLIERAIKTNQDRDAIEAQHGLSLSSLPITEQLATAIAAISTGIEQKSWDCVAEGAAMIIVAEALICSLECE